MPELPEVETVRRKIVKALQGQRITEVHAEEGDRFLFRETPLDQVKKALLGARFEGAGRKGKYFWLKFDRRPWPILHLGMSGNVEIRRPSRKGGFDKSWGGLTLWSNRGRDKSEPRLFFCRLLLVAENGAEVAFTDPRRFGRIWLAQEPLLHHRVKKLGFDPLLKFPSTRELGMLLKKRKAPIKAVLLDQKIFAGVGNWIADEILFQAGIAPKRIAADLSAAEVGRIRAKTLSIVKTAVAAGADYERFPKSWLFHHRWGKNAAARTAANGKIIHEEIGGRTTAWVPSVQK
ncbi:MAG: Fpg/Nei family DNA glycosylase [Bdellovibrionota bacterium]